MSIASDSSRRFVAGITYREEVVPPDRHHVRRIVESSGYFHPAEVQVAVELVEERLAKGAASGYHFVFADRGERTIGYTCYGPIAATAGSFDLYWIAVDQANRGKGLGGALLAYTEQRIRASGGPAGFHRNLRSAAISAHPGVLREIGLPQGRRAQRFLRSGGRQGHLRQATGLKRPD